MKLVNPAMTPQKAPSFPDMGRGAGGPGGGAGGGSSRRNKRRSTTARDGGRSGRSAPAGGGQGDRPFNWREQDLREREQRLTRGVVIGIDDDRGALVADTGQFGDLMLSSIKRDLGIKDMARTLPGHGGFLDRFDSLLLTAPAVFYFINYVQGVARNVPVNIITGSLGMP